jgi:hypothetical protein
MFTRPLFGPPDLIAQHELLDRVAELADEGTIHSTLTTELTRSKPRRCGAQRRHHRTRPDQRPAVHRTTARPGRFGPGAAGIRGQQPWFAGRGAGLLRRLRPARGRHRQDRAQPLTRPGKGPLIHSGAAGPGWPGQRPAAARSARPARRRRRARTRPPGRRRTRPR